jgi:MerR family transcriptional regulator, light-induced transcriptional regulator
VNVLEELTETSRRTILVTLLEGPKNVSELVDVTGMKQPNVSNHLGRLRARGYVSTSKIGRQVYYTIASLEHEESIRSYLNHKTESLVDIDLHAMAKDYAKAAVRGSEPICNEFLEQALRARSTMLDIYEQLFMPAMTAVGTWYKVEAIDEGQEHMASEITLRMMARAANHFGPIKRSGFVAVLGCAPNNRHVIGLRMVGDYLHFSGWDVIYTGPDTPYDAFIKAVRTHAPDLVLLSCATEKGLTETVEMLKLLSLERGTPAKFVLGVGGLAVQEDLGVFQDAGANFTASSLRSFAELSLPEIERVGKANKAWSTASLNGFTSRKDR